MSATEAWIQREQAKAQKQRQTHQVVAQSLLDLQGSAGYSNAEMLEALRTCVEERVAAMPTGTWLVMHSSPEGVQTELDRFYGETEAEEYAEWLNENRDAAQHLDGTIFVVRQA